MKRKSTIRDFSLVLHFLVLFLLAPLISARAAASAPSAISNLTITNVRDVSFTVSWVTSSAADGHLDWDTSTPPGMTASDPITSTTTHYVQLSGLSPSTTYYFQVRSGAETDDNGGSYYSVTTGPSVAPPPPGRTVWGHLYENDGSTPVPDAIVYLQVRDNNGSGSPGSSQWASARTNSSGIWFFDLNNLRTSSFAGYFGFTDTADNLALAWEAGLLGSVSSLASPTIQAVPNTYPDQIDQTLPGAPPAAIADLSIALAGGNAHLNWSSPAEAPISHYKIYRNSAPYFTPGPGNLYTTTVSTTFADSGVVGDLSDYFYTVVAVDTAELHGAPSNRVGKFDFVLTPGE